jgi:predicted ATPase/class 3 adenylate cyclase
VLFTDLVGSTALRSRIGEEAADALRVKHDALIGDAIDAHRGVVVKHTGDGAMATFSAAVDAVAAAVAIQQAVDGHNRRSAEERMEVRVGISVGDVTFTGDDCFGLPVIEAQRLEASADGGQILCAEIVRHLARGRGGHEFENVGDLDLKGIPDPVPAVAVRWEPVVQVAMPRETPLPAVLVAPAGFDLAGRQEQLASLVDAWKDSAEGRRRVVLVSGEPGIGKTRLAIEAALVVRHQGGLVLGGRCDEELALPYQPFAEALRFQSELDDVPTAWFGPFAGELTRLVPDLGDRVPGVVGPVRDDPDAERARLFEAVVAWLRATAASVPVMLVLDDVHWADAPTLQLLRHVVHETPQDSLFVVGTYRSTDLDRAHPLAAVLADLRRDGSVTRLALDGLTADGVAELLERSAGHDLDEAGIGLAHAVFAETGGNPFFVGEIVRHLVESRALVLRDGRWTSDLTLHEVGLPEGVREVVGRRISRLDDDTQRLLSVAAVIGPEFGLPLLAAVAGVDEDRTVDLLDAALATSLVNEVGLDRYRFGHALVRSTLLEELTTTRRVRTHRKIAETIETQHAADLDAAVAELAYHYGEAAAAEPGKAIEYAMRAGAQANAALAADDAVRWYGLALEHLEAEPDDVATRVAILTGLARAEFAAGSGEYRVHLREAARQARDAGLDRAMAEALLVHTRTSFDEEQDSDPEKIELLEDALARLDDEPALRARLMGTLAIELIYVGEVERRTALLREAQQLAAESDDAHAYLDVSVAYFNARARSTWTATEFQRDRESVPALLAAADAVGDVYLTAGAHLQAGFYAIVGNDGAALRRHAGELGVLAERARPAYRMQLLLDQMVATLDGRLVEAQSLSVELFRSWSAAAMPEAVTYQGTTGVATRREQCRLAQIVDSWTAYLAAHPRAASADSTIAFALLETGQIDAAAGRLHEAGRAGFDRMPTDAGWPISVAMWSEVAAGVADRECAASLHALLEPLVGLNVCTGGICLGPAARLVARLEVVLDRPEAADRRFEESVDEARRLASPVWTARCLLDWAESRIARGARDHAGALVAEAEAAMTGLDLPRLEQQRASLRVVAA